jgi:hypothetical protein
VCCTRCAFALKGRAQRRHLPALVDRVPGRRLPWARPLAALFQPHPPLQDVGPLLVGDLPAAAGGLCGARRFWRICCTFAPISRRTSSPCAPGSPWPEAGGRTPLREVVLSVAGSDGGQVAEALFSLCGGSSERALPATKVRSEFFARVALLPSRTFSDCLSLRCVCCVPPQTSLLGDLLVNVGCIFPAPLAVSPAAFLAHMSTELVLLAVVAMLSSFAVQGQADAAAQLLLPDNPCPT